MMRIPFPIDINGFSNYITGETEAGAVPECTLSISFTPYTYETCESGLLNLLNLQEKAGLALSIAKGGIVKVSLGTGEHVQEFSNLNERIRYQEKNLVTLSFWGTAGWCDLCVNGRLANRMQLPRHSYLHIPKGKYYIGKHMPETDGYGRRGIFHGRIHSMEFVKEYIPYKEVQEQQRLKLCEGVWEACRDAGAVNRYVEDAGRDAGTVNLYVDTNVQKDRYRPVFHLMPPAKWMNEPHAPFFYRGKYHIFYQANPHAPIWDNLSWGHLISDDMVGWEDAGIALSPDVGGSYDKDGCWSGSACLDEQGVPRLFYTAGNHEMLPNQAVAMAVPDDRNDGKLLKWKKCGVILTQGLEEGFLGEYRDPFVFRRGDNYYFLVGTGDAANGGGNALLYSTKDFQEFDRHGLLMEYDYELCPEVGHVWELPVLLPLKNEQGEVVCDILLFCACQIENEVVETYYFLGKFSEEKKRFEAYQDKPGLLDLGYGTFTGPSGFVTPDGRSVVFTIAQGKRKPADEYTSGWAHNGGIPVELSLRDGKLMLQPIAELREYFKEQVAEDSLLLENRILLTTEKKQLAVAFKTGEDGLLISYDRESGVLQAKMEQSGKVISKYRGDEDKVDVGASPIEMEIFIDHSMLEIYLNKQKSMTLRNYCYETGYRMELKEKQVVRVSVWKYTK